MIDEQGSTTMVVTGRRMRMLLGLVVVVGGLAAVSPAVPAGAEDPPPTITIGLERSYGFTYEHLALHGKVTPAGATKTVVLQRFVDGAWADRTPQRVQSFEGDFTIDVFPHDPGPMRLRVRSAGGTVISDEVVLDVKRHPTVIRAGARPDQVMVGQRTAVSGSVIEPGATPRVVVQRRVDGRWSNRDAGPVNASGHFFVVITPSQPGPYELRVRSANGSRWSDPFTINVSPRPIP